MARLVVLTVVAVLLLASVKPGMPLPMFCWTRWYSRYNPEKGDYEDLKTLRSENPGKICPHPVIIEAVTVFGNIPAKDTGQEFYAYDVEIGFICRNEDQRSARCLDYKVHFGCPCVPSE